MRVACYVVSIALGAALAPETALAWCQQTTAGQSSSTTSCPPTGTPLAWRRRCLSYSIHEDASLDLTVDEILAITEESFQEWLGVTCDGVSPGFDVRPTEEVAECNATEYNSGRGNANTIVFVDDWTDRTTATRTYSPSALALTTVWHHTGTGEIYDADIEINQQFFRFANCEEGCPPDIDGTPYHDLGNTLTHEIGHFFGLAHTEACPEFGACEITMFASADPGELKKRTLHADDIEGLCAIYDPGTLPDECDYTPRGGLSYICGGTDVSAGCNNDPGLGQSVPAWLTFPLVILGGVFMRPRRRQ